tara:strand:- start:612 stop:947 length:336 start_codon:yes stop_codon:yes gene_type:complete
MYRPQFNNFTFEERLDNWVEANELPHWGSELTYILIHPDDKPEAKKMGYEYAGLPFRVLGEGDFVEPQDDKEARELKERKALRKQQKAEFKAMLNRVEAEMLADSDIDDEL